MSYMSLLDPHVQPILEAFKTGLSCGGLAKQYQVKYPVMWKFLTSHSVEFVRRKLTSEQETDLAIDYLAGMRPNKLGPKYGIATETARDYVNRLELEKLGQYRVKQVDEAFFDTLAEASLWVLGWFYSDGTVSSSSNKFGITVHSRDKESLKLIGRTMGCDVDSIYDSKTQASCEFYGCHPKIHDRLIALGCIPNKSLTIRYPTFLTEDWQH